MDLYKDMVVGYWLFLMDFLRVCVCGGGCIVGLELFVMLCLVGWG
jgi:hypothetical protein